MLSYAGVTLRVITLYTRYVTAVIATATPERAMPRQAIIAEMLLLRHCAPWPAPRRYAILSG